MIKSFLFFLILGSFSAQALGDSIFSGVNNKIGKCYSREYSAKHMDLHPKQTVVKIAAKLFYESWGWNGEENNNLALLKIQAQVKNDSNTYGVTLACSEESGLCAIDCDGPSVVARWSKNNLGSLLIDNSMGNLTLDPLTCDDETFEAASLWLKSTRGGDDIFRLDPMPDYQCL